MKDQILKELASPVSKVRVSFATVAMGMGVDIPLIRHIIHVGPPVLSESTSKKLGEQVVMEVRQLLSSTTAIMTLQGIVKECVRTSGLSAGLLMPASGNSYLNVWMQGMWIS